MIRTAITAILLIVVFELVGLAQTNSGFPMEGGTDLSSFLTRVDSNNNRMLDPGEMQGPARFMLDRLKRDNPKLDLTRPVPITEIVEAFQRMRSGSLSGSSGDDDHTLLLEKTNLVPGFSSTKKQRIPVRGFGVNGKLPRIKLEEHDFREAQERLRRYDRNGDQALDADELKEGRWTNSPMQFDRDRDGRLSLPELALCYAQHRTSIPPGSMRHDSQGGNAIPKREKDRDRKEKEKPGLFDERSSYRTGDKDGVVRPAGLPDWIINLDANRDNQVSMNETGWTWNQDTLTSFFQFDINRDGFITSKECMIGIKDGYTFGALDRVPTRK